MGSISSCCIVLLLFVLIFIDSPQSSASRLLLQEKTEELVVGRGNPSKMHQNMQGRSQHKESTEVFHCDRMGHGVSSSTSHQDLRHPRPEDCEDDSFRQFEDGDYIYTNSIP